MLRIFGHYIERRLTVLAVGEALILTVLFYVGYFIRYANSELIIAELIAYFPQAAIFTGAAMLSMVALGLYDRGIMPGPRATVTRLAVAFAATFVLVAVVSYSIPGAQIWRSGLSIALPASFLVILAFRMFIEGSQLGQRFERRVMIIGEPEPTASVDKIVQETCRSLIHVTDRLSLDSPYVRSNDPTTLRARAEAQGVGEIVVAVDDTHSANLPISPLLECRLAGICITDLGTFAERETGRVDLDRLRRSWLMFSGGFDSGRLDFAAKRVLDIVVSLILIVLCLPMMLIVALLVKLEDRGPIFYSQTRVGRNGGIFLIHKFRSMRPDAEKMGAQWASENDPRVTRIGRIIRATRIDELPQLVNVLRGEMSFIGPRPERPMFVRELEHHLPFFNERHRIKPGLSGWAQINHKYTSSIEDARIKLEYDMYYLKNWSLFLDFLIIAQTLRVVLSGNGAR